MNIAVIEIRIWGKKKVFLFLHPIQIAFETDLSLCMFMTGKYNERNKIEKFVIKFQVYEWVILTSQLPTFHP